MPISVFPPTTNADADSAATWNSLYYMIGRPQAYTVAHNPCSPEQIALLRSFPFNMTRLKAFGLKGLRRRRRYR
eukprot:3434208-Prymnesium_polylepis.1